MRRLVPIAMTLLAFLFVLAACSDDAVSPNSSDPTEKRGKEIYDPPPGFDSFMFSLSNDFDRMNWVEVPLDLPAKMGGTISVVPAGYPATHPILITREANPEADKMLSESRLWVAVPDPGEDSIYVNGDCILFRTQNIPPEGTASATIKMPVMPWYDTSSYSGIFTSYDLRLNTDGWPDSFVEKTISIIWPDPDPEIPVYLEAEIGPDKDEPSGILDRVLDPDVPGDDDED